MIILLRLVLLFMTLFQLLSCTPGPPYEIKSPCVAIESDDPMSNSITPCIRRSINRVRDIA